MLKSHLINVVCIAALALSPAQSFAGLVYSVDYVSFEDP